MVNPFFVNNKNAENTILTAPVLSHLPPIVTALFYQINTPSIIHFFRSFYLDFDVKKPATTTTMWKKWEAEKQYKSEKSEILKNETNWWCTVAVLCAQYVQSKQGWLQFKQNCYLVYVCISNEAWTLSCLCDHENGMPIETHHVCLCATSQHTHSHNMKRLLKGVFDFCLPSGNT